MAYSWGVAQKTLKDRVSQSGVGVHSGKPVRLSICPADPNTGIVFVRTGIPGCVPYLGRSAFFRVAISRTGDPCPGLEPQYVQAAGTVSRFG